MSLKHKILSEFKNIPLGGRKTHPRYFVFWLIYWSSEDIGALCWLLSDTWLNQQQTTNPQNLQFPEVSQVGLEIQSGTSADPNVLTWQKAFRWTNHNWCTTCSNLHCPRRGQKQSSFFFCTIKYQIYALQSIANYSLSNTRDFSPDVIFSIYWLFSTASVDFHTQQGSIICVSKS